MLSPGGLCAQALGSQAVQVLCTCPSRVVILPAQLGVLAPGMILQKTDQRALFGLEVGMYSLPGSQMPPSPGSPPGYLGTRLASS